MIKKENKLLISRWIVSIMIFLVLLIWIPINLNQYETGYLDLTVSLKAGYEELDYDEKKAVADQFMDEINDYVNEINDKGYPDYAIDSLYKNALNYYKDLDLDQLKETNSLIKERKDKVLEINSFIEETVRNVERFENNKNLNTSRFIPAVLDINHLILERDYDKAYTLALDIETDLELIVLDYIFKSEIIVDELRDNNFATVYVEDLLISSKEAFSGAKTKELLIKVNNESNNFKKYYAKGLIKDIEIKINKAEFVDYNVILRDTQEIIYRNGQLFEIRSKIAYLENKITNYSNEGVNVSGALEIFNESLIYFKEENFDKASYLLVEADTKLESARIKLTITDIIARESIGFLKKNWKMIVIITLIILISGYILYTKGRIVRLKKRLYNFEIEENVLIELIKETQKSKFVEQKIPESMYLIKMEEYNDRLNRIKENIKTVKSVLGRLTKKVKRKKRVKNKKIVKIEDKK